MRFLEAFFRHRVLAVALVVAGGLIMFSYEYIQPRSYSATASVWVDSSGPGSAQYTQNAAFWPSVALQNDLQELLYTRSFLLAVAHDGPLGGYLRGHPDAIGTGLKAVPGIRDLFSSLGSVSDEIVSYLPAMVTMAPLGMNVLNITVSAPSPTVASGTVKTLLDEYMSQTLQAQTASDQVAVSYYGQQVAQAQAALVNAQAQLAAYQRVHPSAGPATATSDVTEIQLNAAVTNASSTYQSALDQYHTAQFNLADVNNQTGIQVIDPAQTGGPTSIKGKLLQMAFIGLVLGLLVDVVVVGIVMALDRSARREDDLMRVLGLQASATIQDLAGGAQASTAVRL